MLLIPEPADARVVTVAARSCKLDLADGSRAEAAIRGRLFGDGGGGVVVGDLVRVGQEAGQWAVNEVLPRRNEFVRLGLRKERQVMFANVERVLILASLARPRTKAASIDRFLVAAMHGGIHPELVLTKTDLDVEGKRASELSGLYAALDMPAHAVSNVTGEGCDEVGGLLGEGLSAVIGNSGVGKSSLLNRLISGLDLKVREVSEWSGKGTHTTTASVLIPCGDEAWVIDTPGMKSFTPWGITRENLGDLFPELVEHRSGCRFRNCMHTGEPDCAVARAVDDGRISESRFRSYLRLLEGIPEPY